VVASVGTFFFFFFGFFFFFDLGLSPGAD